MSEGEGHIVPRSEVVANDVLRVIDEQHEAGISYLDQVPDEYKSAVMDLAAANHRYYEDTYEPDEFREVIARNWLGKRDAFGNIVEQTGYTQTDGPDSPNWPANPNNAAYALLTRSASNLFVGPGAFERGGQGASLDYSPISFRRDIDPVTHPDGVVMEPPQVGERAELFLPGKSGPLRTSRLISVYARPDTSPVEALAIGTGMSTDIKRTFEVIDKQTKLALPPTSR